MMAFSEVQRGWIEETEENKIPVVLFWDLSKAFNTLKSDLPVKKLRLYVCKPAIGSSHS